MYVPAQRQRIDALVATLKRETWDQSVENLVTNQNQYYDLAAGAMAAMFAEPELEEMLSVRRAIKVLNMLEAQPMKQRLEGCRQLFDRVFRVHADELERRMGSEKGPASIDRGGTLQRTRCAWPCSRPRRRGDGTFLPKNS